MNPYAAKTTVTVERTKTQIEALLREFKADAVMMATNDARAMVVFTMTERNVKFILPLPQRDEYTGQWKREQFEQATRTRWRALYLALRAKLEMAATGITTFEDEFLAHIVMPNGETVGEMTRSRIAQAYQSGEVRPLLEGPRT